MGLIDTLQQELERAGSAAREVLDEGKLRLDLFRVRRLADDAAAALGYAVHRARSEGGELDADASSRLTEALTAQTTEITRIEVELARIRSAAKGPAATPESGPTESPPSDSSPSASV